MGRLTAHPELKATQSGVSVTSFTVAVERAYRKDSENKITDFIECVAWRNTAEFISRYFNKGSMIAVEGSIQTENYTDKDGNNRKFVKVLVEKASFCGDKKKPDKDNTNLSDTDFEEIEEELPL